MFKMFYNEKFFNFIYRFFTFIQKFIKKNLFKILIFPKI
jgi:hypothetical protein